MLFVEKFFKLFNMIICSKEEKCVMFESFLQSMENFMNNVIVQQWVLLSDLHYLMSLCAILKIFCGKTVLLISNQLFTDDLLMINFYSFEQRIVLKSLKIISTKDHVEKFKNHLNKQHKNIKFTSEIEENGLLSFGWNNHPWKQQICNISLPEAYIQWCFHKF